MSGCLPRAMRPASVCASIVFSFFTRRAPFFPVSTIEPPSSNLPPQSSQPPPFVHFPWYISLFHPIVVFFSRYPSCPPPPSRAFTALLGRCYLASRFPPSQDPLPVVSVPSSVYLSGCVLRSSVFPCLLLLPLPPLLRCSAPRAKGPVLPFCPPPLIRGRPLKRKVFSIKPLVTFQLSFPSPNNRRSPFLLSTSASSCDSRTKSQVDASRDGTLRKTFSRLATIAGASSLFPQRLANS